MSHWLGGRVWNYHFCLQFRRQMKACSFPSVFPPPPSGSWLIPHRITMVLCTSSSPLSLPCTKRKQFPAQDAYIKKLWFVLRNRREVSCLHTVCTEVFPLGGGTPLTVINSFRERYIKSQCQSGSQKNPRRKLNVI